MMCVQALPVASYKHLRHFKIKFQKNTYLFHILKVGYKVHNFKRIFYNYTVSESFMKRFLFYLRRNKKNTFAI